MNLKEMKDSEQIQVEIEFWEGIVENDGGVTQKYFPLCDEHKSMGGCGDCPLGSFVGTPCAKGTPFSAWRRRMDKKTAQAMVDRLKEIKHRLFRLDR